MCIFYAYVRICISQILSKMSDHIYLPDENTLRFFFTTFESSIGLLYDKWNNGKNLFVCIFITIATTVMHFNTQILKDNIRISLK